MYKSVDAFMKQAITRSPGENEFHQAVKEVISSIWDFLQDNQHYLHNNILDRIVEILKDISVVDKPADWQGQRISIILSPK